MNLNGRHLLLRSNGKKDCLPILPFWGLFKCILKLFLPKKWFKPLKKLAGTSYWTVTTAYWQCQTSRRMVRGSNFVKIEVGNECSGSVQCVICSKHVLFSNQLLGFVQFFLWWLHTYSRGPRICPQMCNNMILKMYLSIGHVGAMEHHYRARNLFIFFKLTHMIENFNTNPMPDYSAVSYENFRKKWEYEWFKKWLSNTIIQYEECVHIW